VHFPVAWMVLQTDVTDIWSLSILQATLRYIYCYSRNIRLSHAYCKTDRSGGLENIY